MSRAGAHPVTVHQAGLLQCRVCGRLTRPPAAYDPGLKLRCPRCSAAIRLHQAGNSIQITWALLVASAILYIPANLMPVMSVYMLGKGEPSTIIGGVVHLLKGGQWPLALIVFVASIVVPLLKLFALTFILVTIHRRSMWRTRERALLYRVTEFVGRWSMVDVFVIAILSGLVQCGGMARIEANIGTVFFAAVVVLTMLSARTLAEHLLWEVHEARAKEEEV